MPPLLWCSSAPVYDMPSRQFMGKICFIKVPKNDYNRVLHRRYISTPPVVDVEACPGAVNFPADSASQSERLEARRMSHTVREGFIQPGFCETQSSRVQEVLIYSGQKKKFYWVRSRDLPDGYSAARRLSLTSTPQRCSSNYNVQKNIRIITNR